jgi:N-acetylglucosamine-6-phosphate deacetylase
MIVLSGAALVLPDRILSPGTLTIDDGRIVDIRADATPGASNAFAFHGHYIVPGFIDVHVHGVDGVDSLDGGSAVRDIAARLPRYGVTAFCPTTVACGPADLRGVLDQVRLARESRPAASARVLPAHLESNFINPDFNGAQPRECLRTFAWGSASGVGEKAPGSEHSTSAPAAHEAFSGDDILAEIARAAPDVGIVTLAPEIPGGLDLVRLLASQGHRVSLGHSGATYEEARDAIAAGARHATHLFNRMPPLHHRSPGLAGAILQSDDVAAEIICDAYHVHPALVRTAIASKRPGKIMAITDGTAVSGLAPGSTARLGGRTIVAGAQTAVLADGTLAGSSTTMDGAFRVLTGRIGLSLVDAAVLTATTPARELGLVGHGVLAVDAVADLVVLDANLNVVQTYIAGQLAFSRNTPADPSV